MWTAVYFILALAFLLCESVIASENIVFREWNSGPQLSGGKTKTCFIGLDIVSDKFLALTMNFAILAEPTPAGMVRSVSSLKITATETTQGKNSKKVNIHYAWIKSSSASTVGKIKTTKLETDPNYLGAGKYDLFFDVLDGVVKNGVVIGYQEKPQSFDKIFEVRDPPPDDIVKKLYLCLGDLEKDATDRR